MLDMGMGHLIPEEALARDHRDTPLLYGRFCVYQGPSKDRRIFDGRIPSLGEVRLQWLCLPSGAQRSRLRHADTPGQQLDASGGEQHHQHKPGDPRFSIT